MSTKENTVIDQPPIEVNRNGPSSSDKLITEGVIIHAFTATDPAQDRVSYPPAIGYAEPKPAVTTLDGEGIECPRCNGSGYVEWTDIERLGMNGRWWPGTCRYCEGSGIIPLDLLRTRGVTDPPP